MHGLRTLPLHSRKKNFFDFILKKILESERTIQHKTNLNWNKGGLGFGTKLKKKTP